MLGLRLASAAVGVPLLFGVALLGGPLYGIVLGAASTIGAWEARRMLRQSGRQPLDVVLFGLALLLPLHAWFLTVREGGLPLLGADSALIISAMVMLSLVLPIARREITGSAYDWALSLGFGLYLGGLAQFYAPLRDRPGGDYWVIAALGATFICDSLAYFVGRAFGRTRLAPAISPGKSTEGAAAGIAGAALAAAIWAVISGKPILFMAGFGAAIGAAAVLGDLAESLLKRQTGVKDSGAIVPGHGGILDRMDSLLFCAPVAVFYLRVFGQPA